MGDLVENLSYPTINYPSIYEVPYGGLKVDVKTSRGNVTFALLTNRDENADKYWIVIGDITFIRDNNVLISDKIATPGILTNEKYCRFWVSWDWNRITLGRLGESTPIVSLPAMKARLVKYVAFPEPKLRTHEGQRDSFMPVHWRFELPPVIPHPRNLPLPNGDLRWERVYGDAIPQGAVVGGHENGPVYIIRAEHQGALIPGKFLQSERRAFVGWSWDVFIKNDYEVLVGYNFKWTRLKTKTPHGALITGFAAITREPLFTARAHHNGHLIPGKYHPSNSCCYITYENREIQQCSFEVLVATSHKDRCITTSCNDRVLNETPPETRPRPIHLNYLQLHAARPQGPNPYIVPNIAVHQEILDDDY